MPSSERPWSFPMLVLALPRAAILLLLQSGGDVLPAPDPAVTRAELEHHVRFLASDELGGRAPLTSGMERAAQYLAQALSAAGVEPAGEDGSYFQATGLKRVEYPSPPRLVLTYGAGKVVELRHGVDFNLTVRGTARSTENLPLRYYYDYNHERMPLAGNPAEAVYFSGSKVDKRRVLEEKGIASLGDWGLEIEVMQGQQGERPGKEKGALPPRLVGGSEPEACELVELRGPILENWVKRAFTHVQLLIEEAPTPWGDNNVVGRIRGAGTPERPELAREAVLLSAHYDHLGIRPPPRGRERDDSLFNGADDNASGCATLLELAQAFARGPRPARTLVFLFTTGEESGGKGMARYMSAPSEPLAATVANVNLEMLGRPDALAGGPGRLWLTGFERSSLGPAWQAQGLAIVADPRPDESFFARSDNYPLALAGVVAQSLSSFGLHKDYHRPGDEADRLDFAHLESAARLALQGVSSLADGSLRPAWLAGMQPVKVTPPGLKEIEEFKAAGGRKKRPEKGGGDQGDDEDER